MCRDGLEAAAREGFLDGEAQGPRLCTELRRKVQRNAFEDGTQAASAGSSSECLSRDRLDSFVAEDEKDLVVLEQGPVLLQHSLGPGEQSPQICLRERFELDDQIEPIHELRKETLPDQYLSAVLYSS